MAGGLTIKSEQRAEGLWAALSGDITEESNFAPIVDVKPAAAVLDLEGIVRINSTGVREWINFIAALKKNGTRITLEKCSVPIVQQLNMIANFRGGGEVRSIFAPYFCTQCDSERSLLFSLADGKKPVLEGEHPCPVCKSAMEFDDLPDSYLSFMSV